MLMKKKPNLEGKVPESWACIDCGINTAPGNLNREQMEQALAADRTNQDVKQTYSELTENLQRQASNLESCGYGAVGWLSVHRMPRKAARPNPNRERLPSRRSTQSDTGDRAAAGTTGWHRLEVT